MAVHAVRSAIPTRPTRGAGLSDSRLWLDEHGLEARLYPSGGLDGLATAALLSRRAGGEVSFVNPFGGPLDTTAAAVVIDRGIAPVQTRAPVLYVDHHAGPEPVQATVLWDDSLAAASLLGWRLIGSPDDAGWLAGLGIVGDRGPSALAASTLPVGPIEPLRRLAALCQAASALRNGPLTATFTLLRSSASASTALHHPAAAQLERARARVEELARQAATTPPRTGAAAALLEIDVPARVEARLAGAWARRLAPLAVVVLNRGSHPRHIDVAAAGLAGAPRPLRNRLAALATRPALIGPGLMASDDSVEGTVAPESAAALVRAVLAAAPPPG